MLAPIGRFSLAEVALATCLGVALNFLFDIDPASNSTVSSAFIDAGDLSSPPIPANLPTVNGPLGQPITGVVVADFTGRHILAATGQVALHARSGRLRPSDG